MALNIKNPEVDALAHQLAAATGETLTEAVHKALEERLGAIRARGAATSLMRDVTAIQQFVASLPVHDRRPPDEVLGYDGFGLPS